MDIELVKKKAFSVIGKEGSTREGPGFVKRLREEAEASFREIIPVAKKKRNGNYAGFWGAMSDFSRSLKPWEKRFSEGLYLYGAEADIASKPPHGWTKWIIPSREYLRVEVTFDNYHEVFNSMVYFQIQFDGYDFVGAACDFDDPETKKSYIYFPVRKHRMVAKKKDETSLIAPCGLHCGYCFFHQCGGCLSDKNFCSYGYCEPDRVCPNIRCLRSADLKGCYQCPKLEECHLGFFSTSGETAYASSLFIKKRGKEGFEKAIKNMVKEGFLSHKVLSAAKDEKEQLSILKRYYSKNE